jgi:diguanylate cyclase (GGDEF)-like protein
MLKAPADTQYSDKDRELLGFVSAQVATAIERSRLKAELLRAARYDELTGLPNRRLFHDRIDTALARSRRKHGRVALLYIDIDDFKAVNDRLGHDAGDLLLQEIARRLERCVRKADTVARLGGDEFVVILEDIHGPDDATAVADKIHHSLQQPTAIAGHVLTPRPASASPSTRATETTPTASSGTPTSACTGARPATERRGQSGPARTAPNPSGQTGPTSHPPPTQFHRHKILWR